MKKRPLQNPIPLKDLTRSGIQGTYINIIKATHRKLIANIKFNEEKLKAITLKSRTRLVNPYFPYLFNIVLKVLVRAMRQWRQIKKI